MSRSGFSTLRMQNLSSGSSNHAQMSLSSSAFSNSKIASVKVSPLETSGESKISSPDNTIINRAAVSHQHRLHDHISNKNVDNTRIEKNMFKPIWSPSQLTFESKLHKRPREENAQEATNTSVTESLEESVFKSFKRCKITRSSGELRLKRDIKDVISRISGGHVKIVQVPKDPLRFDLIVHRVWPSNLNRVSTSTFMCKVNRFYPHEAPHIYLKAKLNYSCSKELYISNEDGKISMPILQKDNWSPIYTLYDVIFHLVSLLHIDDASACKNGDGLNADDHMELDQSSVAEPLYYASNVNVSHIPPLPAFFQHSSEKVKRK